MKDILIIEDEEAASKRLHKMIHEIMPDANILSPLVSIKSSVEWLQNNPPPGLVFLDVHLADGESFEIFRQTRVTSPIIFTTAYDQYALDAFKVNSIDYLLKPIKNDDLKRAIDKYLNLTSQHQPLLNLEQLLSSLKPQKLSFKDRFVVKYGEHIKTIETTDIAYFYTENKVNFIVIKDGKRYITDNNLDQLEELLDPGKFFRINRQFIISLYSIADMLTYAKSRVLVKLNPPSKLETIVSTERSAAFKAWLNDE